MAQTALPGPHNPSTDLTSSPARNPRGWLVWLGILAAILVSGAGVGCLLYFQGLTRAGNDLFIADGVAMFLWTCAGVWHWLNVVWVRRIGWFFIATGVVAALGGCLWLSHFPKTAIFLTGAWTMLVMFLGGLMLIRALLAPGWPFLGVARTLIDEAIRMKISLVFIVCLAILVPYLPLFVDPAERLEYRLQFFLTWAISGTSLLLSLMTIFLACGTICSEIKQRQIFLTMTKPVSRFQYLLGKWLGVILLDFLLVSVAGVGIYAGTCILALQPARGLIDSIRVRSEVLVARQSVQPTAPGELDDVTLYDEHLKNYRLANQLDTTGPATPDEDAQVRAWIHANWFSVGPKEQMIYSFHGLGPAKEFSNNIQLRLKATVSPDPPDHKILVGILFNGRPAEITPEGQPLIQTIPSGQYEIIEIPPNQVDDQGNLNIGIVNFMSYSVNLEPGNGLEILYRVGRFEPNLIRTLLIVWIKLVFLAMLGLTAGTFLGFSIASLTCMVVLILASCSAYIAEAIDTFAQSKLMTVLPPGASPTIAAFLSELSHGNILSAVILTFNFVDKLLVIVLSAFSAYTPVELLVDGRLVPIQMVRDAAIWLVLVWTVICGLVGLAIFHRRELARVTV